MKRLSLLVFLIIACVPIPVFGGLGLVRADDPGLFTHDGYSVIVAEVREVAELANVREGTHSAKLRPLATLAGAFDATAESEIHVRFSVNSYGSAIMNAPPPGSTVVVVMTEGNPAPDHCDFMPGGSSIVVVNGLADKKVTDIIEVLRTGRAKAEAEHKARMDALEHKFPPAGPSTRPSGDGAKKRS